MDRQLLFHDHISIIYKKSSQHVGVLMRLRNVLPTGTKLQLFCELNHLYKYVLSKTKTARINGSRLISVLDSFSSE